jgi:Rne/Rng family ribonuclease
VGISRRIEDEAERKRLKEILHEPRIPKDVGFIVRTAACGKSRQEIYRDAYFLRKMWKRIEKNVQQAKPASLIYEEYDLVLRVIRDSFTDDVTRLIVDSKDEFYRIQRFMKSFLAYLVRKVELYKGADLFLDKDIERQISKTFDTRVYLKSKAHIVIEPTEGLVVIDVNSGGFKDRFSQEETAFKVNCEAAIEVAHQLRLRDLGGIIVIDFIDMEKESHRRQVLSVLKSSLEPDRAKYDILGISKFGVVEMTRERVHNTVQTMTYQQCPYCHGKGKLRSSMTMAIYALKELRRSFKTKHSRQVNLVLHPSVAGEILKDKTSLLGIERKYRTKISLVSDPSVHVEEVKLTAVS